MKEPALEPDPLHQAALKPYQCPVCRQVNDNVPLIGVTHRAEAGIWNGKEYQMTELYELRCERCRTHYYQKKYI